MSVTLRELGLDHTEGYHIMDLYDNYDYGIVTPERRFKVDVNPSGSKFFNLQKRSIIQIWKIAKIEFWNKNRQIKGITFFFVKITSEKNPEFNKNQKFQNNFLGCPKIAKNMFRSSKNSKHIFYGVKKFQNIFFVVQKF